MMSKPLCIYHGNCADGFTAAWAVRRALGAVAVDFHPGVHGRGPPDVVGRDVIMVDFSYKRAVIDGMSADARSILILDHHKTAQEDLIGMIDPPWGGWKGWLFTARALETPAAEVRRVAAVFDVTRSGAQIAWDYFMGSARPPLVDYVGDRDLWLFKLPKSRQVNAYILAHECTFENWDILNRMMHGNRGIIPLAEAGAAIERKHHKDVAELVAVTKRRMTIGGHKVWAANLPHTLCGDAGNLMAQGEPFAACYWDTPSGRVFSLRSVEGGLDVSQIAAAYGGGGHVRASGFQRPLGWEGGEP